jgi:hypothetical protein
MCAAKAALHPALDLFLRHAGQTGLGVLADNIEQISRRQSNVDQTQSPSSRTCPSRPTSWPLGTGRLVPSSNAEEAMRDYTGLPSISSLANLITTPDTCEWRWPGAPDGLMLPALRWAPWRDLYGSLHSQPILSSVIIRRRSSRALRDFDVSSERNWVDWSRPVTSAW